ncbi:CocE/NonD family hydrolase [Nocardioides limicola]|uniref:CocE/NonD family hydrolase n=1 Tax=Nocardioides limicola TaxID=2803368 RepID=UPI00193B3CFA|nr:CocE/NonD family hydrolase [Nocardioides sp. DJM-14]
MRRLALPAALLLAASAAAGVSTAAAEAPYTVQTLHFGVTVGPDDATECRIIGDLYLPADATPNAPVPAILTTNGFGGSKESQAPIGHSFAQRGYAVLAYSGLGFGGSTCKITLDHPDFDGKAASQLVDYLAGDDGIAHLDAGLTEPAPTLDVIALDGPGDPRVGTLGGSYGGGFQFAVASIDPRIDALAPLITWNDLSYSLGPNGTDASTGVSSVAPGAVKLIWGLAFSGLGMASDLINQQIPPDLLPCPNFADFVCPALVTAGATGYLQPEHVAELRAASVSSYLDRINAPVLLIQGQHDTLFNLNESVATYEALRARGVETKLIWQSTGHSGGAVPGELDFANPEAGYVSGRILAWFEHHLKGRAVDTGPPFSFFRDWVDYDGNARPAYGISGKYPAGSERVWRLSGDGRLVTGSAPTLWGTQSLLTPAAGLPTSIDEADVLGSYTGAPTLTLGDLPGTFAQWTSAALTAPIDVVGIPTARLRVIAPGAALTQGLGPSGQLVLFVKLVDVAPDGSARLIKGLEAPVRIPDVTKPFDVALPGIVHRFDAGHRLRLVVAGGSLNYRGGLTPVAVTIAGGDGQQLTLPVVR